MAPRICFPLTGYAAHLATTGLSANAQRVYVAAIRHLLKRVPEPTVADVVALTDKMKKSQREALEAAWARYCEWLRAEKARAGTEVPALTQPPPVMSEVSNHTDGPRGDENRSLGEPPDSQDTSVIPASASSVWLASND